MEKITLYVDSRIRAGKDAGVQVGIIASSGNELLGTGMFQHRKCHDPETGKAYALLKAIELAQTKKWPAVELVVSSITEMPKIKTPKTAAERYFWCAADLAKKKGIKVTFKQPTDATKVDTMLDSWRGPVGYRSAK
jgi:hypothetical protein